MRYPEAVYVLHVFQRNSKYGIATSHFYWVGAIPAMVFVGIFMMPFYYGSRARSVPEYLKLRFDEKTRTLNAVSFACMTVFSSGVSMYAMGKLLNLLLGWNFDTSVLVSAAIVLAYVLLGGLTLGEIRRGVSQTATLGYWMGAPHAGKGYMTRAVRAAALYGFKQLRLHRIEAACVVANAASARLLIKNGFQREGRARAYLKINGVWHDHELFALLDTDTLPPLPR